MTRARPLLALVAMATVSGCADPYAQPSPVQPQAAGAPGELPAPPVTPQSADAPTARRLPQTPQSALAQAAELTSTWTSRNAADRQARLAAIGTGPARRQALQAAQRLRTDPLLRNGNASSTGRLEAIALRDEGRRRTGLIVTREQLTVEGSTHAQWRVTLVTVTRHRHGWAIERWEPQP